MPDLRKDPIVGRWVIIAKSRAKRPHDFDDDARRRARGRLLPVLRRATKTTRPREIIAYRDRGTQRNRPGWRVRVVPNKFPALEIEGELNKRGDGIYDMMSGVGAHEVIIECPQHLHEHGANCRDEQLREVLWVYRDRLVDLKKDPRLVYGMIFKNVGAAAGASLEHTHSQLIVTPIVPINVWEEMTGSLEFFNYRGRCIYCDMIQQELAAREADRARHARLRGLLPVRQPLPLRDLDPAQDRTPATTRTSRRTASTSWRGVMRQVIGKIEAALDRPAYNYIIHTAPFDTQELGPLSLAYRDYSASDEDGGL